jgi:hypothetical protein
VALFSVVQPDLIVVDDGRQVLEYVVTEPTVALFVRHDEQSFTTTTSSPITELLLELLASYLTGGQQLLEDEAVSQT